jgi:hypothetical protein
MVGSSRDFLVIFVCLLVEVLVLLGAKVYESTTGEYIRTQQALTIGLSPSEILPFPLVPELILRFPFHSFTTHKRSSLIIASSPIICPFQDVAIRIGLMNFAEVYTFPHMIGTVPSMISGLNRPNETPYPNVRDLRCPYSPTTASQGLENNVEEHLASTPKQRG